MAIRLFVVFSLLALFAADADAATFVVDNLADANDASAGNGVCDIGNGTCSFRAAVQEANALAGPDRIELVAGTHVLSITSTPSGGSPTLVKPSLSTEIEVVGAGTGQSILFADVRANAMIDVLSVPAPVRISNLTFDVRTGSEAIAYLGSGHSAGAEGMILEDVQLLANSTVPSQCCGAGQLIAASGSGRITLRRAFLQTQRVASNGWVISASHTGGLLIEDSTLDGGGQYRIAILQNLQSASGPVTVLDSTFRNFNGPAGFFGAGDAVLRMRLFNLPGQAVFERTTFENSFQGINIVNEGHQATVTVTDSLFNGVGAAVRASGPATVAINNSTISNAGTGIALVPPVSGSGLVDMTLNDSTITGSSTSISVAAGTGTLTARNSIIANGTTECVGTLTSAGHNLVEGSCTIAGDTTGNIIGTDPQLAALADNGGPTLTHALSAGSPAVDAGDETNCPATDQRGFSRPADGDGDLTATCDIGAFEKDAVLVTNQPPNATDDSASVDEDSSVAISVSANDTDTDGNLDASTVNTACGTCSDPANGVLVSNGDGSFGYTPDGNFFGMDSFVYEICDTDAACDTATVDITVDPVNDPPVFTAGPDPSFPAGTSGLQSFPGWPQSVDLGPNETQAIDSYGVTTVSDPDGILSGAATISNGGELSFTLTGASGSAQLEATLTDDGGTPNGGDDTSAAVAFTITVVAPAADLAAQFVLCTPRAAPAEAFIYSIEVDNLGPDAAQNSALTHNLPPGSNVTTLGSPDCVDNGDRVDCDLGSIAAGSTWTTSVEVTMPDVGGQLLQATVSVAAATADPSVVNNDEAVNIEVVPGLVNVDGFESCTP